MRLGSKVIVAVSFQILPINVSLCTTPGCYLKEEEKSTKCLQSKMNFLCFSRLAQSKAFSKKSKLSTAISCFSLCNKDFGSGATLLCIDGCTQGRVRGG